MPEVSFRVIDLETTSMDPPEQPWDGIVEIGFIDVVASYNDANVLQSAKVDRKAGALLFNPPGGIPAETRAIHHISPAEVAKFPACTEGACKLLLADPTPYALVAHNNAFERTWLDKALGADQRWVCTMKVAARLYEDWPSHSNQAARYLLGLELDDAVAMPPHRAGPDAYVTAHIFVEFLKTTSVRQMVEWTKLPRLLTKCPIGQWRGKLWSEVPADFLRWMISKAESMDADAKFWAQAELQKRADFARQPDLASSEYG